MKNYRLPLRIIGGLLVLWGLITFFAQYSGGKKTQFIGQDLSNKRTLIVYNPDPFNSFNAQISNSLARGMAEENLFNKITTVKRALKDSLDYDCYIICANTYNWSPDWLTIKYIKNHINIENKDVVAITLGAGSTKSAKKKLEKVIQQKGGNLIYSEEFWLMKPNDESRAGENNKSVANELAFDLGVQIAKEVNGK